MEGAPNGGRTASRRADVESGRAASSLPRPSGHGGPPGPLDTRGSREGHESLGLGRGGASPRPRPNAERGRSPAVRAFPGEGTPAGTPAKRRAGSPGTGSPLFEKPAQRAEQKDGGGTEGETEATSTAPRPEMERSPSHFCERQRAGMKGDLWGFPQASTTPEDRPRSSTRALAREPKPSDSAAFGRCWFCARTGRHTRLATCGGCGGAVSIHRTS